MSSMLALSCVVAHALVYICLQAFKGIGAIGAKAPILLSTGVRVLVCELLCDRFQPCWPATAAAVVYTFKQPSTSS